MALQLQNFTPIEPQHYTLAETQSEKEAEMARQMARDAANNAAQASTHAMGLEAANAQHAATLAANGQQSAVENDLNKQRINAGINQVGLANAREQEKNNATAAQNAIDNKRQAFADQNTLQQQGLTNARAEKENTQKDAEYQRKLAIENQHSFFNNIGTHVLLGEGADNIDVSGMKQDFSNIYGDAIPKDGALSLNKNKAGGYDLMGVANGQATQLNGNTGNPLTYSQHALDMFTSSAKSSMGGNKAKDIFQYEDDNGNKRLASKDAAGNVIDVTPNSELEALRASFAPKKGTTTANNTNVPTAAPQAGLGSMNKSTRDGVDTYSNKAMPSAPAPTQGLASQGPAPAVQAKQTAPSQLPLGDQLNNLGEKVTQGDRDSINNAPQAQKAEIAQGIISRISRLGY